MDIWGRRVQPTRPRLGQRAMGIPRRRNSAYIRLAVPLSSPYRVLAMKIPLHNLIRPSTWRYRLPVCLFLLLLLAAPAHGQDKVVDSSTGDSALQLEEPFPSLRFTRPVDFQAPGDGSGRIFVVEQAGIIKVFDNSPGTASTEVFLDIRSRVRDQGNEEGLLGLAFHPAFASNGYFFVDYTASNPRRTVVARYSADPNDPDRALPGSGTVILQVAQPYSNHNGGQIVFGPDGYLYVALGDGGSGGDPQDHGENPATLPGSILRIDVDGGSPYAIPPDNPFVGNTDGYREEIYAYGLRNPWRISFDSSTGRLWAADVGQNLYEEVNIIEKGGNYGWDIMEGLHCYEPATGCNRTGLTLPVWEYSHDLGISITGGFVYRGTLASSLEGRYVFADYGTGRIWALASAGPDVQVEEIMNTNLAISSFGVDDQQELYVLAFNGSIYRFAGSGAGSIRFYSPDNLDASHSMVDGKAVIHVIWTRPGPEHVEAIEYFEYRVREGYYVDAEDSHIGSEAIPWTRVEKSEDGVTIHGLLPEVRYLFSVRSVYADGISSARWMNLPVIPALPVSISPEDGELPSEVTLGQNYPNPFNPETTIRYALPQAGKVRLAVYDLLGHEVAVLVDTVEPAGNHAVRFDAGDLPSGAYTYRLRTANGVVVRTMMLVK